MQHRVKKNLTGLVSMVLGSALVFTVVVMINRFADGPQSVDAGRQAAIDFQKKEAKPPAQKKVEKKEPPKKRARRAPPNPVAGLSTQLSGLDLGLPGFDTNDLDGIGDSLLGDADDVVMTDESVDQPPKPTRQLPMQYPVRARANGVEGYVLLTLLISPTGEVEQVKVLDAQPPGIFDETAMSGVQKWKFEPAMYQGESVRVWAKQRVRFDLG